MSFRASPRPLSTLSHEHKEKTYRRKLALMQEIQDDLSIIRTCDGPYIIPIDLKVPENPVVIIGAKFEEFDMLALNHGFQLIIKGNSRNGNGVWVSPVTNDANVEAVYDAIHKLYKEKMREENSKIYPSDSLESRLQLLEHQFASLPSHVETYAQIAIEETNHRVQIQLLQNRVKDLETQLAKKTKRFFMQESLSEIKKDDYILDRVSDKLSSKDYSDSVWSTQDLTKAQKRSELVRYLGTPEVDPCGFRKWFNTNLSKFNYIPAPMEAAMKKVEYAEEYGMEGVVGTVHLQKVAHKGCIYFLTFAIFDKRIINSQYGQNPVEALEKLHAALIPYWKPKWKFALTADCDNFKDLPLYVRVTPNEAFTENHRVMKWIENNMDIFLTDDDEGFKNYYAHITPIFNMSVEYFEDC